MVLNEKKYADLSTNDLTNEIYQEMSLKRENYTAFREI